MNTTVVIVSFKSEKKIYNNLNKFRTAAKVLIIENSENFIMKKKIEKKFQNIEVIINKNQGYSQAINLGARRAKSKYIFFCTPDNFVKKNTIEKLENFARLLNDKFGVLSLTDYKNRVSKITKVRKPWKEYEPGIGSFFMKKKVFSKISGFDEKFFLYVEDKDFIKRLVEAKFLFYRVPLTFKDTKGSHNKKYDQQILINKNWHFMWSKFYFYRKLYGYLISILITSPYLVWALIKTIQYINNPKKSEIYKARISGLINGYFLKKAWFRPNLDK